jgi:hypothetical protein
LRRYAPAGADCSLDYKINEKRRLLKASFFRFKAKKSHLAIFI